MIYNAPRMRGKAPLAIVLLLAGGCVTGSQPIPSEWMSVPAAARIGSVTLDESGKVTTSAERTPPKLSDGPIRAIGATLMNGDKVLAEKLVAIDSLDLSEVRQEVAFSAKRDSFDIALIATEGGAVHWMPHDPADELAVQWAPRGHKISYIIRATAGDIVRTLHIPTAFQFAIPFANATIHSLAWDPQAERFAVAYSTPEASDRVEVLEYDGDDRRVAIAPERTLDVQIAPFAPGAIVLHPRDIRYDEKLPLVVWRADDFSWSDARAALLTNARVAVVITTRDPSAELWRAAEAAIWIDASRTFVVGTPASRRLSRERPAPVPDGTARRPRRDAACSAGETPAFQCVAITADPALNGRYERRGNIVAVPAAVLQSFAAGYIAAQLERDPPTNGSSR
jgi:hypothetical protein